MSPWHKEIVYALQYPGVKGIYGAASMGALRASELDFVGMVGIGQIYNWYRDAVTEDDAGQWDRAIDFLETCESDAAAAEEAATEAVEALEAGDKDRRAGKKKS